MKITVRHVSIPMRYAFGHARAKRAVADNVLVEVELADGARGWGECVPREYVTGESIASVFAALSTAQVRVTPVLDETEGFGPLCRRLAAVDLPDTLGGAGARAPAAACALELALLDAYARREARSTFEAITEIPAFAPLAVGTAPATVRQTLTIADELEAALDRAGRLEGPLDVKVKLGFAADEDRARVATLRARFGAALDLRGDANAAWTLDEAAALLPDLRLSSIEEPLKARDLTGCAALRRQGERVMLDESLCSVADAERAIAAGAADLFNLRVSKCGGLLGTLRLVALAERAGMAWQVGCMVGESGILASVARQVAARIRGARYLETTVPEKSLEQDLTDAHLDHLPGTRETPVPQGPGFGAEVRAEVVERYTISRLMV